MSSKNTKVKKKKKLIELKRRIDEEYEWDDDRL